jgi:hypothetical protein
MYRYLYYFNWKFNADCLAHGATVGVNRPILLRQLRSLDWTKSQRFHSEHLWFVFGLGFSFSSTTSFLPGIAWRSWPHFRGRREKSWWNRDVGMIRQITLWWQQQEGWSIRINGGCQYRTSEIDETAERTIWRLEQTNQMAEANVRR